MSRQQTETCLHTQTLGVTVKGTPSRQPSTAIPITARPNLLSHLFSHLLSIVPIIRSDASFLPLPPSHSAQRNAPSHNPIRPLPDPIRPCPSVIPSASSKTNQQIPRSNLSPRTFQHFQSSTTPIPPCSHTNPSSPPLTTHTSQRTRPPRTTHHRRHDTPQTSSPPQSPHPRHPRAKSAAAFPASTCATPCASGNACECAS